MDIIPHPSPNFSSRPSGQRIDTLILHYTGMPDNKEALERLCHPDTKVSAHYFITETGKLYQLVADRHRAWHAGISCWRGKAQLNDNALGIEITNPGHDHGYYPFPKTQMDVVITLSQYLVKTYAIPARNVIGHSDIAPSRKKDPGELFDWELLAQHGVGLWPEIRPFSPTSELLIHPEEESMKVATIQKMLAHYGYHIRVDGYFGWKTRDVIIAFKRHFVPNQVNSQWNSTTHHVLESLLKLCTS